MKYTKLHVSVTQQENTLTSEFQYQNPYCINKMRHTGNYSMFGGEFVLCLFELTTALFKTQIHDFRK